MLERIGNSTQSIPIAEKVVEDHLAGVCEMLIETLQTLNALQIRVATLEGRVSRDCHRDAERMRVKAQFYNQEGRYIEAEASARGGLSLSITDDRLQADLYLNLILSLIGQGGKEEEIIEMGKGALLLDTITPDMQGIFWDKMAEAFLGGVGTTIRSEAHQPTEEEVARATSGWLCLSRGCQVLSMSEDLKRALDKKREMLSCFLGEAHVEELEKAVGEEISIRDYLAFF